MMIAVFHGHNISLGFANTQNRHMPAVFTVTVSGPSPHTSRPLSRSDHARVWVSAFGMYHSARFGTDLVGSYPVLSYYSPFDHSSYLILDVYYSCLVAESPRRTNLYLLVSALRSRAIPTPDFRPASHSRAFRPADPNNNVDCENPA